MDIPDLTRQRQVVSKKPSDTRRSLKIKLEGTADIRTTNPHGRCSRADINKWNPATPRGEVVAQVRRKANQPAIGINVRVVLHASEEFQPTFEVASIPVISPLDSAKHMAVREAEQSEIVGLTAAKHGHTGRRAAFNRDILGRRQKAITYSVLPNRTLGWA